MSTDAFDSAQCEVECRGAATRLGYREGGRAEPICARTLESRASWEHDLDRDGVAGVSCQSQERRREERHRAGARPKTVHQAIGEIGELSNRIA
jgi:hypothetical protein